MYALIVQRSLRKLPCAHVSVHMTVIDLEQSRTTVIDRFVFLSFSLDFETISKINN